MIPRPTWYRAHHISKPVYHGALGRATPHVKSSSPLSWPGTTNAKLLVLLAVVAVVDVAVVPDGGPGEVPEVDHVKEL